MRFSKSIRGGIAALALLPLLTSAHAEDKLAAFNTMIDQKLEKWMGQQTSGPPTSGPAMLAGKSVVVIPCSMAAEGCARPARAVQEATSIIGWKATVIDPAGDPSKMSNALEQALSLRPDAIITVGLDPQMVQSSLKHVKDEKVLLVGINVIDNIGIYDHILPDVDFSVRDAYAQAAAAYKILNGEMRAIIMHDPEFAVLEKQRQGYQIFLDECVAAGGDCKVLAEENFLVSDLQTKLPNQITSVIRRNPTYNVVLAEYDAAITFMAQGLAMAGLDKTGFAVGSDANAANTEMIRQDGWQKVTIGVPLDWFGYAAIDDINRILNGQKPVDQGFDLKVITKANVPETGGWSGDLDVKAAYTKLWSSK